MDKPLDRKIGVIGLGYVGLPLAVEFGRIYDTTGFDRSERRVKELASGLDRTQEISADELKSAGRLSFTADPMRLAGCDVYIVCVPTPVDRHNKPDLGMLISAGEAVGKTLRAGGIVVYESTVYPGCTEEECAPVLEKASGLKLNKDFFVGYSPERINPGDKEHTLTRIVKVTSGSTPGAAETIDALYRSVIKAGTHKVSSIKVAEAAKVIENTQRDINIAFMNELALIFNRIGIDTQEVLEAAGTKWNFLRFRPGLVGGHCIGVDPFYLTHKAQEMGYYPEIILAGRRLNDGMGKYVAGRVVKLMIRKGVKVAGARVLALGITFKENCPDTRNSRAVDVVRELADYGCLVDVYDPRADRGEALKEYGIELVEKPSGAYRAVVLAVAHKEFAGVNPRSFLLPEGVVYDIKGFFDRALVDERL